MSENDPEKDESSSAKLVAEEIESGRLPRKAGKRYLVSLLVVAASASVGNVMLKYGLLHLQIPSIGSVSDLPRIALQAFGNIWLDIGMFLFAVQFMALTYALRYGPLSLTVPLRGASTYVVTALLAKYFLQEEITLVRWAAIILITIGISLIGISEEQDG